MLEIKNIRNLLRSRGRIVGFMFDGSKEQNEFVKVYVWIADINARLILFESIVSFYIFKDSLMDLLVAGKKSLNFIYRTAFI